MKIIPLLKNGSRDLPALEVLKEDFEKAERFGEIRVGEDHLFYRGFIRVKYVPFKECSRIYLRIEFGEYGDFPLHEHYVVVVTKKGRELLLRLERPDDAKGVMECLKKRSCGIILGKEKAE